MILFYYLLKLHVIFIGGLYAGATAGGNIKASAGLAGGVTAEKAAGAGYASAQAGNNYAVTGMVGDTQNEIQTRQKEEKKMKKNMKKARR